MRKDVKYSDLALASSDEHTLRNETNGGWENCAASSVMTKSENGIQEIMRVICEQVVRPLVLAPASSVEHTLRKETIVGGGVIMFTCEKVVKSYVKGASVGPDVMTNASRQGVGQ